MDPNRVVDCVLEAFECQLECNFFVTLLRNLKPSASTICEIIGFKLMSQDGPSFSLYKLTALLMQYGMIKLDDIYPWVKIICFTKSYC